MLEKNTNNYNLLPVGTVGRRRKEGFAEKGVRNVAATLEHYLFTERIARSTGFLQQIDPRAKLLGILILLISASFSRNLIVLGGFYILALILAIASRVPLGLFVTRIWLFMPLFTGIIAFPSLFNFVTPGDLIFNVANIEKPLEFALFYLPPEIGITRQGLTGATVLILRVTTSVSLAGLLTLTTPWPGLLRALRVLRIPSVIIFVLAMTYRYIFLLLRLTDSMLVSLESRKVGRLTSKEARRWTAASIGSLMGKSYELSSNVYLAMISRGFQGNVVTIDPLRIQTIDWLWFMFCIIFITISVIVERLVFTG